MEDREGGRKKGKMKKLLPTAEKTCVIPKVRDQMREQTVSGPPVHEGIRHVRRGTEQMHCYTVQTVELVSVGALV